MPPNEREIIDPGAVTGTPGPADPALVSKLAALANVAQRLARGKEAAEVVLSALEGLAALAAYEYALLELIPGFGQSGLPTVFRATPELIELVAPSSILVDDTALILPLESGGRELGRLRVVPAGEDWEETEVMALRALAAAMGLALKIAELEMVVRRLTTQEPASRRQPAAARQEPVTASARRVRAGSLRAELSHILSAQLGLNALCERVLERFVAVLEADAGAIFTYDDRGNDLIRITQRGVPGPLPARQAIGRAAPTALGRAVAAGTPDLVPDIFAVQLDSDEDRLLRTWGFHTLLCCPLMAGKRVAGALQVMGRRGNAISPESLALVTATSDELALALQNAATFERLSTMAVIDGLTTLHNRRFCEEFVRKYLLSSERTSKSCGFLLVDIDNFKSFNDRFGHAVGDAVLRSMAAILLTSIRSADLAGRYGGEEFMVALPTADYATALSVAERIRTNVQGMSVAAGSGIQHVTVSIGVSCFPECAGDLSQLFATADAALYAAKDAGRNCVIAAARRVVEPPAGAGSGDDPA